MGRYLLGLGLLAATAAVVAASLGHFVHLGRPTSADLMLASGVLTMAIAARVSL